MLLNVFSWNFWLVCGNISFAIYSQIALPFKYMNSKSSRCSQSNILNSTFSIDASWGRNIKLFVHKNYYPGLVHRTI